MPPDRNANGRERDFREEAVGLIYLTEGLSLATTENELLSKPALLIFGW
jgi:hypothetical protein